MELGEIDLGLLTRRRLETNFKALICSRAHIAEKIRHCRVAAGIAALPQFSKQSTAGQAGIRFNPLPQVGSERIDDRRPRLSWTIGRSLKAAFNVFAHRLTIDASLSGNCRHRQPLLMQIQDHDRLPQLDHQHPLPTIGKSIGDDAPPVFRGAPRKTGGRSTWGRFKRHY